MSGTTDTWDSRQWHPRDEQAPCRPGLCLPFLGRVPVTPMVGRVGDTGKNMVQCVLILAIVASH